MVSRVVVAHALLLGLVATAVAQNQHPQGRIAATLYPVQGAAQRSKAAAPYLTTSLAPSRPIPRRRSTLRLTGSLRAPTAPSKQCSPGSLGCSRATSSCARPP